jgi:hypothetical protein
VLKKIQFSYSVSCEDLLTQIHNIKCFGWKKDLDLVQISSVRPLSYFEMSDYLFCSLKEKLFHTISLFVHLSICLIVYLSICLFVYLSVCLFVYLSICLFVYLSICLFVNQSICFKWFFALNDKSILIRQNFVAL